MWWDDTDNLASTLLACCGGVRMLHVGAEKDALARELFRQGIDVARADTLAHVRDAAKGRCVLVQRVLDGASVAQHAEAAAGLLAASPCGVMLLAQLAPGQSREQVESAWLEAGWRRHPRLLRAVSYEGLEHEEVERGVTLLFEPVPAAAHVQYPLSALAQSKGLHMDMLRVATRRSDAHLARYSLACELVRRGDRVLDVACGLGYGSWMLRTGSDAASVLGLDASDFAVQYAKANYAGPDMEFRVGDASAMRSVPDASVDIVISMETLEHVEDPARMLAEFARVLTPGGRVVVSVPNQWGDTKGPHPNPHHLHEYTWEELRAQLEAHFLPERRWRQTAGGGRKLPGAARQLASVAWEQDVGNRADAPQAEWWLASAMKSPLGATKKGYEETIFRGAPADPNFHVAAFARDYDNPWLVRAMVGLGDRLARPPGLVQLAEQVRTTARAGSPDQGAAVCVLAYQALAGSAATPAQQREVLGWIDAYDKASDASPHAWRWQISNRFAAGRLWLALGDRAQAHAQFAACAGMDVLRFSPLLATKTVEACLLAGVIDIVDGKREEAKRWWVRGLEEARRVTTGSWLNVWGTPQQPMSFGLRELGEVLDAASRCAGWLLQAEHTQLRPGLAWTRASALSHAEQRKWAESLNAARVWLDAQRSSWAALATQREKEVDRLAQERGGLKARELELERTCALHQRQAESWRTQHELVAAKLAELQGWVKELEGATSWHQSQAQQWRELAEAREKEVLDLRSWSGSVAQAQAWHKTVQDQLDWHVQELARLTAWNAQQQQAMAWHLEQATRAAREIKDLQQDGQQLRGWIAELERTKASFEQEAHAKTAQLAGLEERLAQKDAVIDRMILRMEAMRTWRGLLRSARWVLFGGDRGPDPRLPEANKSAPH